MANWFEVRAGTMRISWLPDLFDLQGACVVLGRFQYYLAEPHGDFAHLYLPVRSASVLRCPVHQDGSTLLLSSRGCYNQIRSRIRSPKAGSLLPELWPHPMGPAARYARGRTALHR